MDYEHKFNIVRNSLIQTCKNLVSENHTDAFDVWLLMEGDMEFGYAYQFHFKEQFGSNITDDVESQLWFSGKHLVYLINTFRSMKNDTYLLSDLLEFVEKFIYYQLDDFDNDYDTIDWT